MAAVGVVPSTSDVIGLEEGARYSARFRLLFCLPSRGHQHLDLPRQQLLPINFGLIDVVLGLSPGFLNQPVALRFGDPSRLSRIGKTSGVGLTRRDHFLGPINSLDGLCCCGSCNYRSNGAIR